MIDLAILTSSAFLAAGCIASLGAYSQYVLQRAGCFSTSPVAFIAIGAYLSTYLILQQGWPTVPAVLLTVIVCGTLGAVLGQLVGRLRGAYVAIATLSVVLVVQQLATIWKPVTGGASGIVGIPVWTTLPVLVSLVAVTALGLIWYENGRMGRRQASLRMDEVAAAAVGINVARAYVGAMAVSSAIAGLAGAATAGNLFAIEPTAFGFALVVILLSAVVVGGYRSPAGPIIGAFLVAGLPLVFSGYPLVAGSAVGLATILILRFFPRGVAAALPIEADRIARAVGRIIRWRKDHHSVDVALAQLVPRSDGVLRAESVARAYGEVKAVQGVSLLLRSGAVTGLIGPNGAGKTSVINLLAGVTRLDSGTVTLDGEDIHRLPAHRLAQMGIARTFQACRLFGEMTVLDNVRLAAGSGRTNHQRSALSDDVCAKACLALAGYQGPLNRLALQLSYADQRRVEIARALATEPSFMLLDEPAAGMTETEVAELAEVIKRITDLQIGILVVDHNVNWIFSVCDHVHVQHLGRIISAGPPEKVRNDPVVIEAYIGSAEVTETKVP